jgi:uncharacterized protein (DUF488 family)
LKLATIGVYGWTLETFLAALRAEGMAAVMDVRQRRGVRGSEYAWANAQRLQTALASAGLTYRHHKEVAPTTELRELQYAEDAILGIGKRSRTVLGQAYRERYVNEILNRADLRRLLDELPGALLCVERDPEACHRSLVAERLASDYAVDVVHLLPERGSNGGCR